MLLKNLVTESLFREQEKNRSLDYSKRLHVLEELEPKVIEHEQHFLKSEHRIRAVKYIIRKNRNQ
jgi:hypothetical protein